MINLLEQFSLNEIVVFVILLGTAVKGFLSFLDWLNEKGVKFFNSKYQKPKQTEKVIQELINEIKSLKEDVGLLMESDKDDIKAFITRQHHYFCYQLKQIDDQSLDCIEKRYSHYKDQGGNSYIDTLMHDLRSLPRSLPKNMRKE